MPDIFMDDSAGAVTPWLMEFKQAYEDGLTVDKRGLDATAMVIKKYGIAADEVVAFSNHRGRRRASTVFHFHPEFPATHRRDYMKAHREGYDLAMKMIDHVRERRRERAEHWRRRVQKLSRAASSVTQAMALHVLAHGPEAR